MRRIRKSFTEELMHALDYSHKPFSRPTLNKVRNQSLGTSLREYIHRASPTNPQNRHTLFLIEPIIERISHKF
jgi:hypothetical protein